MPGATGMVSSCLQFTHRLHTCFAASFFAHCQPEKPARVNGRLHVEQIFVAMSPRWQTGTCTKFMRGLDPSNSRTDLAQHIARWNASCNIPPQQRHAHSKRHREEKSHASCQLEKRESKSLPPPHQPHTDTRTCAAASGTIPLRLCKGPRLRPRQTFRARRPKLDRCLCGRSCRRWRNQACAAFPRATPTARVAKRSAGVLPCGPASHSPALDDASVNTTL